MNLQQVIAVKVGLEVRGRGSLFFMHKVRAVDSLLNRLNYGKLVLLLMVRASKLCHLKQR